MTDLFGEPTPLRAVLHFNLWGARSRLDWDLLVTNAATGDIILMDAHVAVPAHKLGPSIARALLDVQRALSDDELGDPAE